MSKKGVNGTIFILYWSQEIMVEKNSEPEPFIKQK